MSKTGNLKIKGQVSFITFNLAYMFMNNVHALAENAVTKQPASAPAASGSSMPLIIGVVALIVIGAVVFMMTKKKDSKIQLPESSNKITPPTPSASKPVVTPPKPSISTPPVTPSITPKVETPVAPKVESVITPPQMSNPIATPPVSTPVQPPKPVTPTPVIPKVESSMPANNMNSSEPKPLFDASKLDSDLDGIFNDPKSPSTPVEEKKAPLFDPNQLDDDLDALFVEVNKKPEPVKEEKKGLFDSNQLGSDLDNLFAESSPSKSSDNSLDSLFDMPSSKETTPPVATPQASQTFDLGDLDSLYSEPKNEVLSSQSSPALDLSSLGQESSSSSSFDLKDLDFLATDTKKEEAVTNGLQTIDLNSLVNSSSSPLDTAPLASKQIDLDKTAMGLNISEYLNSFKKPEDKKEEGFNLSNTIPPHSLNVNDLKLDSSPLTQTTPEADKKDAGVISIGKMLVDQNALEEIIKKAEKGGKAGLTTTQVITAVKGRSLDTLLVDINNVSGILGSIIVGKDGLVIANTMPDNIDKDLVGALTSSLFTNIDTQIKKMQKGNLKRLTVETASGLYILTEIEMGTLVVFGKEDSKVNLSDIYKSITAVTGKK